MSEINGVNLPFLPIGGARELERKQHIFTNDTNDIPSFRDMFEREAGTLKFSAHARARIASRDISLSDDDIRRLERAAERAEQKGGKDSLVVLRDMAFIVSATNRIVITAIGGAAAENIVFTNIDSAVFA
ncbi:hypothetical protein MASR2M18_06470 [Ignavibacteria bacterium]|jgi:flagellar operon protein|nr:flagellar protein [Bacteroidota bacterium]MCZ2132428.1 flagellar protein [Bacteroidota bacterium]